MLTRDALAVYRLTRLITKDDIAEPFRQQMEDKLGHDHRLVELVNCPWCVSVWIAFGAGTFKLISPSLWSKISAGLAWSALAGFLAQFSEIADLYSENQAKQLSTN